MLDLQGTGAALSWSIGTQYDLSDRTRLGVSYQHQTDMTLDGSTRVDIPGLPAAGFDSELHVQNPASLGIGTKHLLKPSTTLAADVIWYDWSSAFNQFDLHLSNPDDPTISALAGGNLVEQFPLFWKDSVSLRLCLETPWTESVLFRTGYVYHDNPIPSSTLSPYIQTILEHAFSVGFGWTMGTWKTDVAYPIFLWQGPVGRNKRLRWRRFRQQPITHILAFFIDQLSTNK